MTVYYHEVIKRDGLRERFDVIKIVNAIQKAAWATGTELDYEVVQQKITAPIEQAVTERAMQVEEIQDMVEVALMQEYPKVAKAYILYRDTRNRERAKREAAREQNR